MFRFEHLRKVHKCHKGSSRTVHPSPRVQRHLATSHEFMEPDNPQGQPTQANNKKGLVNHLQTAGIRWGAPMNGLTQLRPNLPILGRKQPNR